MKAFSFLLIACVLCGPTARGQEASPSATRAQPDTSEIPKGYEIGQEEDEKMISPDGRFAILLPVRNDKNDAENGPPYPPNLLVRLRPYLVLAKVRKVGLPRGWRDQLRSEWNGNGMVAIWEERKWGTGDLTVYEIENDKVKRAHPIFKEARNYFERDFHQRFLKKYPNEHDGFTFVSNEDQPGTRDFQFKGRKLEVHFLADNKPNLAPGPHWSAELFATWNLDTARLDKVDFRPGEIEVRPEPE
jgi:hypothetical protein